MVYGVWWAVIGYKSRAYTESALCHFRYNSPELINLTSLGRQDSFLRTLLEHT